MVGLYNHAYAHTKALHNRKKTLFTKMTILNDYNKPLTDTKYISLVFLTAFI